MREMKDSGISWIGLVPYDWKIMRLKYVCDFYNGDRGSNYPSGDDLVEEGIPFLTSNNIHGETLDVSDEITKYITQEKYDSLGGAKVMKNDIIFCLRGSVGTCAINKSIDEGTVASSLVDIRPKKIDPNFLNYILNSPLAEIQTLDFMNGSCALNLSAENVSSYVIFVPSILEQHRISTFLDEKVKEINNAIEKTKETIELYKKYKQAIITEAVTKGLDPNVEMKYSGVEWIGCVPRHWSLRRLQYILKERNEKNTNIITNNILSLTAAKGVIPYSERESGGNKHKDDLTSYKIIRPNDIVVNSMNVLSGSVGLSKYFGCSSPVYYMLYSDNDFSDVRFYNYIFQSTAFQKSLRGLGNGIMIHESENGKLNTIRMRIPMEKMNKLMLPLPPLSEQQKIADFLDKKCIYIDSLIENKNDLLKEIENYKESLIYEYVTGKKEVK